MNSATDINLEVRDMLARRLRNMIADVQSTSEAAELNRMAAARRAAVRDAQRRLQTDMREDEQILQDLINEVRGYIDRGRHGDDNAYVIAERVAEQAVNVEPFSGAATAAQFTAEAANPLVKVAAKG